MAPQPLKLESIIYKSQLGFAGSSWGGFLWYTWIHIAKTWMFSDPLLSATGCRLHSDGTVYYPQQTKDSNEEDDGELSCECGEVKDEIK